MLDKEFQYYLDNQEKLVKIYNGRTIVIAGEKVVGDYNNSEEAYLASKEKFELGTFLIQKCTPGDEDYTQYFYTPRVTFA